MFSLKFWEVFFGVGQVDEWNHDDTLSLFEVSWKNDRKRSEEM